MDKFTFSYPMLTMAMGEKYRLRVKSLPKTSLVQRGNDKKV